MKEFMQYARQKRIDELQDFSLASTCTRTIKKSRQLPVRCTQGP